ncbi:MAG: FecR domain-containing protein [Eubacteriales bacterium]
MKKTKLLSLFLALGLVLSGCSSEDSNDSTNASASSSDSSDSIFGNVFGGGDNSTTADEMRLENYTGNITLQNNSEEKPVVLGSRLVTGDNIETMIESNAYVILDQSKVLRVNETSQVEIIQEDKQLDIYLSKGTVFFNVTTSLSVEESLEFHTNNVVTGVRGTSGIIHFDPVAQITQIVVLTGTVTGTTASEELNIEAGQVAIVETLPDGTVEMSIYSLEEEDPIYYFSDTFVDGIQGDLNGEGQSLPLSEMVRELDMDYLSIYAEIIGFYGQASENYNIMEMTYGPCSYAYELVDLDENGIMELLVFYNSNYGSGLMSASTVVNGEVVDSGAGTSGSNIRASIQANGIICSGGKSGMGNYYDELIQLQDGIFTAVASHSQEYDMSTEVITNTYTPDEETFNSYQSDTYEPKNLVLIQGTPWW